MYNVKGKLVVFWKVSASMTQIAPLFDLSLEWQHEGEEEKNQSLLSLI